MIRLQNHIGLFISGESFELVKDVKYFIFNFAWNLPFLVDSFFMKVILCSSQNLKDSWLNIFFVFHRQ
jgi:hypothetical protein